MLTAAAFCVAVCSGRNAALDVRIDPKRIVARTSDRFVSFNFDFHLCAVEQPGVPSHSCNWHNASALNVDLPRLLPLAASLSPYGTALLRIGGSPGGLRRASFPPLLRRDPLPRAPAQMHFLAPSPWFSISKVRLRRLYLFS